MRTRSRQTLWLIPAIVAWAVAPELAAAQKLESLPPVMPATDPLAPAPGFGLLGGEDSSQPARVAQAYETERAIPMAEPPPTGYGPPASVFLPDGAETVLPELAAPEMIVPEGQTPVASPLVIGAKASGPPGAKPGVLQAAVFNATWMPALQANGFAQTDLETYVTLGFPCPTRDSPLIITPGFETHFLSGFSSPALPSQLYDAYVQIRWLTKLSDAWGIDMAVAPGWHSDFEQSSDQALRITGRVILSYDWTPTVKVIGGLVYLDRTDVNFLPAGGIIWTPTPDWRFELIAPRPRIAYRVKEQGEVQNWLYVAGEFGGGSWAIAGPTGPTVLNAKDYRVLLGYERRHDGYMTGRLELGYVFGRSYQFTNGLPDFDPSSTLLVRGGLSY
ncbi:MAG: DUF6268 family outer membrane beta-barrel protein [Pirellulales bacterium]